MSRDLADLHPCLRPVAAEFVGQCFAAGFIVLITQTRRTDAEQRTLYDQGRTKPGKVVTNAKPGQSPHNAGLAFDIAFRIPETGEVTWDPPRGRTWEEVGIIGEGLGLEWGGRWSGFPDRPHFEWPQWRKVAAGGDPTSGKSPAGATSGET